MDILAALASADLPRCQALLAATPALASVRDAAGVSLLMLALYHGQPELAGRVRALREAGGDALTLHEAAALGAALGPHLEGVIDARSPDGFTPLHLAAFFGRDGAVRELLAAGADPVAVADNPSCVQPLHSAVAAQCLPAVAALLQAGADVNARQAGGWTALMAAAKHGNGSIVEALLGAGATAGLSADDGSTARDLASPGVAALLAPA